MIYIKNFNHDFEASKITFEVKRDGITHNVETKETEWGASSTNIGPITEDWPKEEYDQLKAFLEGCTNIVHQFSHY